MAAATAQLNVRMDSGLKAAGEAGLAEIGFSPSEAVRALWTRAARRGQDAALTKQFLEGATSDAPGHTNADTRSDAERFGWNIVADGMADLGIRMEHRDETPDSYRELLVQALEERMRERGTL